MLVNFTFSNFRSFNESTALTMRAGKQSTLKENLISDHNLRILPTAVIYGPNASGKSNIIMALEVMRDIVLAGNLTSNIQSLNNLELYPFVHSDVEGPIKFEIDFITCEKRFLFSFSIQVASLKRSTRRIVNESLTLIDKAANHTLLYSRNESGIQLQQGRKALSYLEFEDRLLPVFEKKINENFDETELFLSRAFKSAINNDLADLVINFFNDKLNVVSDFTLKKPSIRYTPSERSTGAPLIWNKVLEQFVNRADFGPQRIMFKLKETEGKDSRDLELVSIYHHLDQSIVIPADLMESRGTLKLIEFAIPFEYIFKNGGVFVLDEFDSAIHPELVKGILSLFNNVHLNKAGAQLIFTTHNPIYLNNSIFRRDQIYFVEKNPDTYESSLYSLADFGSNEVRNDQNYLLNYFKGNYGALPFIDFSKLLKHMSED